MSAKRIFAVDFGASGGKFFVGTFENDSVKMDEIHRFAHDGTTFYAPDDDGSLSEREYWDDIALYGNIVIALKAYNRDVSDHLDSIGIDTWGADGQIVNKYGDIINKIYCYRDHRLDPMIDQVKALIDPKRVYEITGIHFQPFNLSNQLLWFVQHRADMLEAGGSFLPIPTVFYNYLGGVREVDSSWASVSQLMDAKTKTWSSEILAALKIPIELMPDIVEPGSVMGALYQPLANEIGINCAKLMAIGSHDTASAFAAAPVKDFKEALIISSGTWSLIGKLVPEAVTSSAAMEAGLSNEGGIGNVRLLKNCMGTWLVQELRRAWEIADGKSLDWKELNLLTEQAPAFAAFIDPDDPSFYNPSNMEESINEFCKKTGQTPPSDRGTYLRVVYESLALKYKMVNEKICEVSGNDTKVVNIVGGGSKNLMLNQFTSDALGLPVVAGPEEGTAVGNIMVQAVGLGIINSMADALPLIRASFPIKDYQPQNPELWSKVYEKFKQICN